MKKLLGAVFVMVAWGLTWGLITFNTINELLTDEHLGLFAILAIIILSPLTYMFFDWLTDRQKKKKTLNRRKEMSYGNRTPEVGLWSYLFHIGVLLNLIKRWFLNLIKQE